MATDILTMGPLFPGPDISKMRILAELHKKATSPPKPFTPLKTKLTTIETKRIMSVLDETIQKVELVTLLSYMAANTEDLEGLLGEALTRAVREHGDLCQTLMDKVSYLQEEEMQLQAEEEFEEEAWFRDLLLSIELQKSNLLPIMGQIKNSTKNILRLLLGNPQAAQVLRARVQDRGPGAQGFIDSLVELRGFLFEKLLTSPMEARDRTYFIQDINRRNRRNEVVIKMFENELAERTKIRAAEVPLTVLDKLWQLGSPHPPNPQGFKEMCSFIYPMNTVLSTYEVPGLKNKPTWSQPHGVHSKENRT